MKLPSAGVTAVLLMSGKKTERQCECCVRTKQQPPALSREANSDVTNTAFHRLAAEGWLQKGVSPIDLHVKIPNFTAEKTCLQPGAKHDFDLYS